MTKKHTKLDAIKNQLHTVTGGWAGHGDSDSSQFFHLGQSEINKLKRFGYSITDWYENGDVVAHSVYDVSGHIVNSKKIIANILGQEEINKNPDYLPY